MNSFLKIRALIALICIIIALSVVSLGIAVRITVTSIEKKDKIVRAQSDDARTVSNNPPKPFDAMDLNKATPLGFYLNGEKIDGIQCYQDEKGAVLLPLDLLLKQLAIPYKVMNADDTMTATVSGKPLILKLKSQEAAFGSEQIKLKVATLAENNHIFVSVEILDLFEGYTHDVSIQKDAVFFYYWPETLNKAYEKFQLLKLTGSKLESYRIFGGESLDGPVGGLPGIEELYPFTGNSGYLVKAGGRFYKLGSDVKPVLLPAENGAMLSGNHNFLYWTDKKKKRIYIFSIKNGKTRSYKNIFTRITKNDPTLSTYDKLFNFDAGNGFVRFDLAGSNAEDIFTVIERDGELVVEGKSHYSPDGNKLAYTVKDKGFFTANADGTDISPVGNGLGVSWIDNNRIIITNGVAASVFSTAGKSMLPVDVLRTLAGTASNGDIFTIRDSILYTGAGMGARQLFRLPWTCDHIYAPTGAGPYFILSSPEKRVIGLTRDSSMVVAETDKFVNRSEGMSAQELFSKNSAVTPDNGKIAFLQVEDGRLQVNLVTLEGLKLQKIVAACESKDFAGGVFELLWLDNNRLLLHSGNRGWVLDCRNGTYVYSWEEANSGIVQGTLGK